MTATFTVQGELTRDGLEAARDQLDELLQKLAGRKAPSEEDGSIADRKADALKERMGETTWEFVHGCAQKFSAETEFDFEDLARAFNVSVGTVKSWHRSASKAINHVNEQLDGPPVLKSRWDGSKQHYRMPAETREAILALAEHEER